jgi:hypothetical protein
MGILSYIFRCCEIVLKLFDIKSTADFHYMYYITFIYKITYAIDYIN